MSENLVRLPIGTRVEWRQANQRVNGEVVTYRVVGRRQLLSVRRSDGQVVAILAEKARALPADAEPGAEPPIEMLTPPLARDEAWLLARQIIDGGTDAIRLPVNQIINLLATAVVELNERLLEGH